jgi:hypothetical protein
MKYNIKKYSLYFAFCYAETGDYLNSFMIKEDKDNDNQNIRIGPLLISTGKDSIIEEMGNNWCGALNKDEKQYLEKIKNIEKIRNKKIISFFGNFKSLSLVSLKISENWLFKSDKNRLLYKNIGSKMLNFLYQKNNYNLKDLTDFWYTKKNLAVGREIFHEKIYKYLNNPNLNTIVNIHSIIQQYNYEKKFFDNNFLYQEKENIKLCAYHIRVITNQWLVSAWNCHSIYRKNILYSSFQINFDKYKEKYIDLFNRINREPWKNYEQEIKNIIVDFIPEQKEYIDYLQEGNIVGIYNRSSSWHKVAFFEAINDRILFHFIRKGETIESIAKKYECAVEDILKLNNMKNIKLKPGNKIIIKNKKDFYLSKNGDSYFELDKQKWTPSDITKQEIFTPIKKKFNKDNAFAFNTHIGIITRHANKIMILHYVYGFVILSPIEKIKPDYNIMWVMKLQKT